MMMKRLCSYGLLLVAAVVIAAFAFFQNSKNDQVADSLASRQLATATAVPQQQLFFTDDDEDGYIRPVQPPAVVPGSKKHHEKHKDLFPLSKWDWAGICAAAIGLMIAAGGGVGGGGILVPVYVLLLRFHPKLAIPLSNITIFGGALTNMALNVSKRHPAADRPLVDWDLILVMEPLTIGGALVGSFINKVGFLTYNNSFLHLTTH
jgi:Sulfite exporter TauE/SafE